MVRMVKYDEDAYVPEECCTMTNPQTSGGASVPDDVCMPCEGGDLCDGECSGCVIQKIMNEYAKSAWIPVSERLPENDKYILVSFKNFTLPDIGRYETDKDGNGAFYPGDEDESYVSYGCLVVNAWMPLPEPYRVSAENAQPEETPLTEQQQTNADRIRNMTDDELAEFLKEVKEDYQWANPDYPDCDDCGEWLEWLKSESEE